MPYWKLNLLGWIKDADIDPINKIFYDKILIPNNAVPISVLQYFADFNRVLIWNGTGIISTSNISETKLNYLSNVSSDIQNQINLKINETESVRTDGSHPMINNFNVNSHRIINLLTPVNSTDAATKSYVDSIVDRYIWLDPVICNDMLRDDLFDPPLTPDNLTCYIVASGGTGVWFGKDNRIMSYYNNVWHDI